MQPIAAPAPKYAPYPSYDPDSCHRVKDHDAADLCAQWRGAIAEKAIGFAWWGNLIGTVGGLLSFVSVVFVYFALRQTERSLREAKAANAIARDTAKGQLRAYVSIEPGGINIAQGGLHRVPFNMINNGQTPAYDLEHAGDFLIVEGDPREFSPAVSGRIGEESLVSNQSIGPNFNRFTYAYLEEDLCQPFLEKITKKEAAIIHYGYIAYGDAFGKRQRTSFAFYHWGEELSDLEASGAAMGMLQPSVRLFPSIAPAKAGA